MQNNFLDAAPLRRHFSLIIFPIILSVLMIGAAIFGSTANDLLRYEREAILSGQVWRLLTGHLVHLGYAHLIMNMIALTIFYNIYGNQLSNKQWAIITTTCGCGISLIFLVFYPRITWYVGFSGILHGLFASMALMEIRAGQRHGWIWLIIIFIKILIEQIAGPAQATINAIGGQVIVSAHLYGSVMGLLCGIAISQSKRSKIVLGKVAK